MKQPGKIKSPLRFGDIPTTAGEGEPGVVSETVPSPPLWHVWEYNAATGDTVYLGPDKRKRGTGEHTYYLTQGQHDDLLAGDDINIELAKDK